jgi:hypothetical protein
LSYCSYENEIQETRKYLVLENKAEINALSMVQSVHEQTLQISTIMEHFITFKLITAIAVFAVMSCVLVDQTSLVGTYYMPQEGDFVRLSKNGTAYYIEIVDNSGDWDGPYELQEMSRESGFLAEEEFSVAIESAYETVDRSLAFFIMKPNSYLYGEKVPKRYMFWPYIWLDKR